MPRNTETSSESWIRKTDSFPLIYHAQTGTLFSRSAPSCWFFFVAFHWSSHLSIWFCIQCIHNPKSWPCRVTMDVTGQWHGYPTHSHFKKGLTWPSWPCLSKTCVRKRAGCLCGHPWNLSIHPLFGKDIQEDSLWRTGRLKETSSHNT